MILSLFGECGKNRSHYRTELGRYSQPVEIKNGKLLGLAMLSHWHSSWLSLLESKLVASGEWWVASERIKKSE
jgi:hypothetical protein